MVLKDKKPPETHKVRGLRIAEGTPHLSQLQKIVSAVKNDKTLDLQIRPGYLNIYFRGGSLLNVGGFKWTHLTFKFNNKYFDRKDGTRVDDSWLPREEDSYDTLLWLSMLGKLKDTMKGWFAENNNAERDLQQELCTKSTRDPESPWVFLDVEYAAWLYGKREKIIDKSIGRRQCKFDMVALKREDLKSSNPLTIYLVELKQGNGALTGSSGVASHAMDLLQFMSNKEDEKAREAFKRSVFNIVKEKSSLGLLSGIESINSKDDMKVKAMFLLHGSTVSLDLRTEAQKVLGKHAATPLFWTLSENNLEIIEYK